MEPKDQVSSGIARDTASPITAAPTFARSLVVHGNGTVPLLTIRPDGTVEAPSLEAASEAGRVFVESVRGHLARQGKTQETP